MGRIALMSSRELESFRKEHAEDEYTLLDVRQPQEYKAGHIPGAVFIPLPEIEERLDDIDPGKPTILYCHSGRRSMAAARLLTEREGPAFKVLFSLDGGIAAWEGNVLDGLPRIEIFDSVSDVPTLLYKAMEMEKGAWRLYTTILSRWPDFPLGETIGTLARMERAHAKVIHGIWKQTQQDPLPFETLFDSLTGNIVEGGQGLKEVLDLFSGEKTTPCLELAELALEVETRAFDLYRVLAQQCPEDQQPAFLDLARQEKNHLRLIARGVPKCVPEE